MWRKASCAAGATSWAAAAGCARRRQVAVAAEACCGSEDNANETCSRGRGRRSEKCRN
ncbi:uncharacterized protein DS421_14g482100 [Arachis hypogaea]|nr:uncharacterized protein DS421_14g482100 [Arachis hypogaea]